MGPLDFQKMAETLSLLQMIAGPTDPKNRFMPMGEVGVPPVLGPMGGGGGGSKPQPYLKPKPFNSKARPGTVAKNIEKLKAAADYIKRHSE